MKNLENAKWIWATDTPACDEHAEFYEEIEFYGKDARIFISADSNYAIYVNGELAAFGQYADYPYDKVYDERDISAFIRKGKNSIAIHVWYYGIATASTYYPGRAGVIYSVFSDGVNVCNSSAATLSRLSPAYRQHAKKIITSQLGLSFEYDAKLSDAWEYGKVSPEHPFSASFEVDISSPLRARTCLPVQLGKTVKGKRVSRKMCTPVSKNGMIFDLGCECVGFITLKLVSAAEQKIIVAFGEHIEDGHVRRDVGGRDFSFVYHTISGGCYFMNPHRRFGCRYIELIPEEKIESVSVGVCNTVYPVNVLPAPRSLTYAQKKIYDASVHTLICCMHEHYEDCPWREQALYTMDSRNQMLAGYYAFGERLFPKANLELIARDNRPDGMLSICYPILRDLVIPSFSMHFITQCEEYLTYTGDLDFIREIYPKMKSVLSVFISKIGENGLVPPLAGKGKWNFYEWQPGLDGRDPLGHGYTSEGLEADIILNGLLSIALGKISRIEDALGIKSDALALRDRLNTAINSAFYNKERGIYKNRASSPDASRLGNAIAILSGAAGENVRPVVAEAIVNGNMTEASLSMRCFVYDALLLVDREKYAPYVISDIERIYTPMLLIGNNTVWETVLGAPDFDNAGSLCHGWSAMPIYYYHTLLGD
ncbi:MAG: family 78 glycoside hydrolase catalytic domain [Clostridia bacterium]|nr:family 78 glycoside hydrolase catalytic domain [Clostridia bacterium]